MSGSREGAAPAGVREQQPGAVAVLDGERVEIAEEVAVGAVRGDEVVGVGLHRRGEGQQLLEQRRVLGSDLHERRPLRGGPAGEHREVASLRGRHPQHPGDRVEHLVRDAGRAPLLEPRVPGGADPGELGDLLAAQAGGAPAAGAGEPRLLRRHLLAAGAQERAELLAAGDGGFCIRHRASLDPTDPAIQVVVIPV
ncbi:hypothetical protein GCM10028787_04880 [Brachybacterium horti]